MKQFLSQCITYEWRWNRQRFVLYPLWFYGLFFLPLIILFLMLRPGEKEEAWFLYYIVTTLIMPIMVLTLYVRICGYMKRLRDLDKTPWLSVIAIIPIVNIGLLIYCAFIPWHVWENQYGKDPLEDSDNKKEL